MTVWVKKGGSELSDSQPFMRLEATFPKAVKLPNLVKTCYMAENLFKYD